MILKGFGFVALFWLREHPLQKTGMFGGPEVSYHETYSARDWLSILRTPYLTQNLQRKYKTTGSINDLYTNTHTLLDLEYLDDSQYDIMHIVFELSNKYLQNLFF
jgi:hypothetical protein